MGTVRSLKEEGKRVINGDGGRLTWGGERNLLYRWCVIELYSWNLYNFINQYHPNKFNNKKEIKRSRHKMDKGICPTYIQQRIFIQNTWRVQKNNDLMFASTVEKWTKLWTDTLQKEDI